MTTTKVDHGIRAVFIDIDILDELENLCDFVDYLSADRIMLIPIRIDTDQTLPYFEARCNLGLGRREALVVSLNPNSIIGAIESQCHIWHIKGHRQLTVENLARTLEGYRITI